MPGESAQERTFPRSTQAADRRPGDPARLAPRRDHRPVAVRARLEARLKARVDGEDWAGAEEALKEFQRLPARETFAAQLARLKDDAAAAAGRRSRPPS